MRKRSWSVCSRAAASSASMSIRSSCRARKRACARPASARTCSSRGRRNFAGLPKVLAAEGLTRVDMILADLGVSSMQFDNPDRGFSYKGVGPLDMRMNPRSGETAAQLIARSTEEDLARLLEENADEPHAHLIARLLKATASRDDPRGRSPVARRPQRGASASDEGRSEDVDPQDIPGAAHRGQRRVLGARCAAAVAAALPRAGRPRRDADVSLR